MASTYQYYSSEGYLLKIHALYHVQIMPLLHLYLQKFRGKVLFHLRFLVKDEIDLTMYPSNRGVTMDQQQVADLLHELPTLKEVALGAEPPRPPISENGSEDGMIRDDLFGLDQADNLYPEDFQDAEYKVHLGKNLFAVAKRANGAVDIREYFFTSKATLQATKKGVYLKREQFELVARTIQETLINKWHGLLERPACHTTHQDDGKCFHCSPRYISPEEKAQKALARREKAKAIFQAAVAVAQGPQPQAAETGSSPQVGDNDKGSQTQSDEETPLTPPTKETSVPKSETPVRRHLTPLNLSRGAAGSGSTTAIGEGSLPAAPLGDVNKPKKKALRRKNTTNVVIMSSDEEADMSESLLRAKKRARKVLKF